MQIVGRRKVYPVYTEYSQSAIKLLVIFCSFAMMAYSQRQAAATAIWVADTNRII